MPQLSWPCCTRSHVLSNPSKFKRVKVTLKLTETHTDNFVVIELIKNNLFRRHCVYAQKTTTKNDRKNIQISCVNNFKNSHTRSLPWKSHTFTFLFCLLLLATCTNNGHRSGSCVVPLRLKIDYEQQLIGQMRARVCFHRECLH